MSLNRKQRDVAWIIFGLTVMAVTMVMLVMIFG